MYSILEVCGQQPPELFDFDPTRVRIPRGCVAAEAEVFKGDIVNRTDVETKTSIIGSIKQEGAYRFFRPLIPFDLETSYTLSCDELLIPFKILIPEQHQTMEVVDIFPATAQVPSNILKWYVRFSRPVNPIKIYDHIQFRDEQGDPIERSILNLAAPLLSDDGTLLTIWVEPGRQKQLLGPNQRLGGVFEPDRNYTLHIDALLKDDRGVPIGMEVNHEFSTIAADRAKPSMEDWEVSDIPAQTRLPLEIRTKEPLDYGSLVDAFSITQQGSVVTGTLKYNSLSSTISFTPDERWSAGMYTIELAYRLEDLAGNNLRHLFDRPIDGGDVATEHQDFTLIIQSR